MWEILYPAYFERILDATGHRRTQGNMRHLIDRVAHTITHAAALSYFEKVGDPRARAAFLARFDLDAISDEQAPHVCDEMIDWLWDWNARCRKDLSERIPRLEALLTGPDSALRSCGPDIPPWR